MKRMYIKPEMGIEEFVTEAMLSTSGGNGTGGGGTVVGGDEMESAANSHRGSWGSLWGGDE